jgi:hypothetical protein
MVNIVRNVLDNMSLLMVLIIEVALSIWVSLGSAWYFYIINFLILFVGSSIFNTAMIQGILRGIYIIKVFPGKHKYLKALGVNTLTIMLFLLSFWVVKHSLFGLTQFLIFYGACSISSLMQLSSRFA